MALDPLKFLVEIQDKASSQLDDLETKIDKVLKDRSFKISIEGIGEIKAALSQVSSTIKMTGSSELNAKFEPRIKALKEQLDSSKDLTIQYAKLIATIENKQANLSNLLAGGGNSKYFDTQIRKAIESYQLLLNDIKAGRDLGLLSESHLKGLQRILDLLASMYQNVEKGASKYNRTQERASAIQQKYEAAVQKTYSNLSIRQNDAGLQGISTAMDNIMTRLSKVREDIDLYRAAIGAGNKESIDFGQKGLREAEKEAESLMRQYVALADALDRLRAGGKEQPLLSTVQSNKELEMLNEAFRKGESELQKQARADAQALKEQEQAEKAAAKAAKEQAKAEKENADGMAQAGKAASNLNRNLEKLNISGLRNRAREAGVDTSAFDAAVRAVERYQQALANIHTNGGVWTRRDEVGLTNANNNLQIQTALLKKQTLDAEAAAKATSQLTAEEQRFANALNQSTQAAKSQSQILGDLKSLATQYLGVWGAQNFIHNIIEIGGQLEKQRLSIAAILQDASHGADLFDKIKRLAVQSPFGVVELDQFTKQLSAYGFKYNELYDMTKRLADISAGAGTEVSRLALALGHVRAEGALSGYTLRQFAMNNIPMVSELAKKLSEVEGHLVTTAEVRKRVANKEIGYSDVEDVIKKLTDEGGMFYRMQEVISESVQAKFKNLRDSMDIMYGDIAKSPIGDVLKDIAVVLTNLTRNWKMFIPIIEAGGAAFIGYKATLLAVNMTMGKNTSATLQNIMAQKQKRASELQQIATYKTLNVAQKQIIANRNILTATDLKAAMSTSALTKEQALLLVSLRKISIEEAAAAVNMGLFTEAEVMAARQSSLLMTRVKLLGVAMKTSLLNIGTMIFNRWNALFALMSFGMSMYQKQEQYNEDRKARIEDLFERSREGQRNLGEITETYKVGLSAEVDEDGLKQAISDLKDKLKDYTPDINKIFNEAFETKTIFEIGRAHV